MPNLPNVYLEKSTPKCLKCFYQISGIENELFLHTCKKVFTEGWDDERNLSLCSKAFGFIQRKHPTYALSF